MTEFKYFSILKLFKPVKISRKLKKSELKQNGPYPCYSSDTKKYGVLGYTFDPEFIVDAENPVYLIFGDHTRTMRIATKSFSVLDNVKVLLPPTDNVEALLYISAMWHKAIPNLGYARHWKMAKEAKIQLPIISQTGKIDWQYMINQIKNIERNQIKSLDSYLDVTGLNNYQLTVRDKDILQIKPNFKSFSIGDLFEKVELKRKKKKWNKKKDTSTEQNSEFDLPLVNAKAGDNGIMYYGRSKDWESTDMSIDVIQNGEIATGLVYAQPQATGVMWDAYLIHFIPRELNEEQLLYFATVIKKAIQPKYDYYHKATWARVQKETIELPVNSLGEIDLDYMSEYIKAIKKISIKDIVIYKDKCMLE